MSKRLIAWVIAFVLTVAATGTASAQQNDCYRYDFATVQVITRLRETSSFDSPVVNRARPGDGFNVIGSRQGGGGCWVETSAGWLHHETVSAVPIATATPTATPLGESCYSHDGVTVKRDTGIKESYSFTSRVVKDAVAGERFAVTGSRLRGIDCWLQTSAGWLHSANVRPDTPPTPVAIATQTPTLTPTFIATGCYDARSAYVSGTMNIRASHGTGSEVVGQAVAGDAYQILQSVQGDNYCWLKIPAGWMALTGRVSTTIPAAGLPRIQGDATFVDKISAGFEYLKDHAPNWFLYVTKPSYTIAPAPLGESTSYTYGAQQRMTIHVRHLSPLINLASVLAHEACHLYQHERGVRIKRWDKEGHVNVEKECIEVQVELIEEIHPGHWTIAQYEQELAKPWLEWDL